MWRQSACPGHLHEPITLAEAGQEAVVCRGQLRKCRLHTYRICRPAQPAVVNATCVLCIVIPVLIQQTLSLVDTRKQVRCPYYYDRDKIKRNYLLLKSNPVLQIIPSYVYNERFIYWGQLPNVYITVFICNGTFLENWRLVPKPRDTMLKHVIF